MLRVTQNGQTREMACSGGSLLDCLRNAGVTGIHAPCGGKGLCKQCTVRATGRFSPVGGGGEKDFLSEELLACRYIPLGDCEIVLPDTEKMEVMTGGAGDIPPCGDGLGLAVDIGTTTIAAYLYDLRTGKRLAVESGRNAQRPFGADVISRIQYCTAGGLGRLASVIRSQISAMADALCRGAGRARCDIALVSIAGNTVMEHIFAGLDPTGIGVAPFTPVSLFGDVRPAEGIFGGLAPDAGVYLAPALAGYVGGDITAGLYSSGAYLSKKPCLFMDIGTNGEMGLGDRDGFVCCATAAGPAFEGAEIECGMDGSAGAISKVWYADGEIGFEVIGGGEAKGVCGSGLVDALRAMLLCGAVEESGRMLPPDEAPESVAPRLRRGEDGGMRFHLTEEVYVSAADVRQLQLAKSAIRAGVETLLALRGMEYGDIGSVVIAGGFGAYMDAKSAGAIGLLPPALLDRARHAGNTAGAGAALALSPGGRRDITEFTGKCEYHELSSSPLFMGKYVECMVFDEWEDVK